MATTDDNEGSVKGKGPEIMLPSRGSPFASTEADALNAEMSGAGEPSGGPPDSGVPEAGAPATPEVRDLSPEEVAALFPDEAPAPGAHGEAEAAYSAAAFTPETMAAEPVMAEPDLSMYAAAGSEEAAYAAAPAEAEPDTAVAVAAAVTTGDDEADAGEETTVAVAAAAVTTGDDEADAGGETTVAVAAAAVTTGDDEADADDTMSGAAAGAKVDAGDETTVAVAAAAATGDGAKAAAGAKATAALQLSEDVGVSVKAYERPAELKSRKELVDLFVTDGRLMELWLQIDSVEADVIQSRASRKLVIEMLDRLATARNMLLSKRDRFENAQREVAQVRYMVSRLTLGGRIEYPSAIVTFLAFYFVLLVLGLVSLAQVQARIGDPDTLVGIPFAVLWNTIIWGGLGGLSASFYSLIRHVEDYDPQHARWYYLSPVMGLIFGPLIAMLAQITAQIGVSAAVTVSSGEATEVLVNPIVLYFLAWVVGFQQNLLLRLINSVLAKLYPGEEEKQEKSVTQETKTVIKSENG